MFAIREAYVGHADGRVLLATQKINVMRRMTVRHMAAFVALSLLKFRYPGGVGGPVIYGDERTTKTLNQDGIVLRSRC